MLKWAIVFLIIAIVAGWFGFGNVKTASYGISKVLFFIFLVFFIIFAVMAAIEGAKAK